jgi:hypothetical protein
VSAQLIAHFGDKVFRTVIPRNIRLAEAPSFGKPALFHDKESRGALAYLALAGEMIRREEESTGMVRGIAPLAAGSAAATAPHAPPMPATPAPMPAAPTAAPATVTERTPATETAPATDMAPTDTAAATDAPAGQAQDGATTPVEVPAMTPAVSSVRHTS